MMAAPYAKNTIEKKNAIIVNYNRNSIIDDRAYKSRKDFVSEQDNGYDKHEIE